MTRDGGRPLRPLLRRPALPARRPRHGGAARAVWRHGEVPRGADVLRPADGEFRVLRRRAPARPEDAGRVRAVRARGVPIRKLHQQGAEPLRNAAARRSRRRRVAREDARAVRVPPRRSPGQATRPLPTQGGAARELPWSTRAASGQRQRAPRSAVLQDRRAARGNRGPAAHRAGPRRRVLRIRRDVRRDRGGGFLRDGTRPHRRSRARRIRGDRRRRCLLPDAPGRAHPPGRQEVARPPPRGVARGGNAMTEHAARAAEFVKDDARLHWHDQAVWFVRNKRDIARSFVPEWEELRSLGSQIKAHTLSRLPEYLEEFERNARAAGAAVHWARDADEHNRIVHGILRENGVTRLVKSKSMLTEECHLNEHLEAQGVEVVDTDLGERIVQFRREPPSHIVMPAIHLKKEEIGELFHDKLGTPRGLADPKQLTEAARAHLREKFLAAQAGLTGVNFAIASTGGVVVCTNEGNADLGTALPPIHIACMGVEKLVPSPRELAVFLRLLARSATGQPITTYTSHFHGPRPGGEMHIVIVDHGRSRILARSEFRASLKCIRCAACLNTFPVYRRSGGHSYGVTVAGPIGSVLAPHIDPQKHAGLPFASTLCGSCADVCPVRIDLHHQLLAWRGELAARGLVPWRKRVVSRIGAWVMARPWVYRMAGKLGRLLAPLLPNPWTRQRELPPLPA